MTSRAIILRDKLVLARLRIKSWNGKTASSEAARSAEQANDAAKGVVEAKIAQVSRKYTGPIEKECRDLYRWWHAVSLPWGDGGWRVIKVERFLSIADEVRARDDRISERGREVFGNAAIYKKIKTDSRSRLQGLFSDVGFPTAEELIGKYGTELIREVLSDPKDIRLSGISDTDLEAFRKDIDDQYRASLNSALSALIGRMRTMVLEYRGRIAEADQTDTRSRFGKLFRVIGEQCDELDQLNLTAEPKISEAIADVRRLAGWDVEGMNYGQGKTRETADKHAANICDMLDALMGDGDVLER